MTQKTSTNSPQSIGDSNWKQQISYQLPLEELLAFCVGTLVLLSARNGGCVPPPAEQTPPAWSSALTSSNTAAGGGVRGGAGLTCARDFVRDYITVLGVWRWNPADCIR